LSTSLSAVAVAAAMPLEEVEVQGKSYKDPSCYLPVPIQLSLEPGGLVGPDRLMLEMEMTVQALHSMV